MTRLDPVGERWWGRAGDIHRPESLNIDSVEDPEAQDKTTSDVSKRGQEKLVLGVGQVRSECLALVCSEVKRELEELDTVVADFCIGCSWPLSLCATALCANLKEYEMLPTS